MPAYKHIVGTYRTYMDLDQKPPHMASSAHQSMRLDLRTCCFPEARLSLYNLFVCCCFVSTVLLLPSWDLFSSFPSFVFSLNEWLTDCLLVCWFCSFHLHPDDRKCVPPPPPPPSSRCLQLIPITFLSDQKVVTENRRLSAIYETRVHTSWKPRNYFRPISGWGDALNKTSSQSGRQIIPF